MRGGRLNAVVLAAVVALTAAACGGDGDDAEGARPSASSGVLPLRIDTEAYPGTRDTTVRIGLSALRKGAPGATRFDVTLTPGKQPPGAAEAWKLAVTDGHGEHAVPVKLVPGAEPGQVRGTLSRDIVDFPAPFALRLTTPSERVVGQSVEVGLVARAGGEVIGREKETVTYPAVEVRPPGGNTPLGGTGTWTEYAFTVRNLTRKALDGYSAQVRLTCELNLADAPCAADAEAEGRAWDAVQWRGPKGWTDVLTDDTSQRRGADGGHGFTGQLYVRDLSLPPGGSREVRVRVKPGTALSRDNRTGEVGLTLTKPYSAEPPERGTVDVKLS
ncbi:hypothetical protein [Streptomyces sp. NPDC058426]|uniref:hypothetical protein n=1 Tax=Streptomyces sp. NPDC058426 TaxID=3346493 RepID=UPI00365150B8